MGAAAGTVLEPGGGTIVGGDAGLVACVAAIAALAVYTSILAWNVGKTVGEAIRPSEPVWDPRLDPQTQQAIRDLIEMMTPDIHTGLPGGGFPEWCRTHPTICKGAVLTIGTIMTAMISMLGGIEGFEEKGGPRAKETGK